jgi:hypothetical protein
MLKETTGCFQHVNDRALRPRIVAVYTILIGMNLAAWGLALVLFLIGLVIGSLEALSIVASKWKLDGGVWAYVNGLADNSGILGYAIIGLLVVSWLVSMFVYRLGRLDRFDEPPVPRQVEESVQ